MRKDTTENKLMTKNAVHSHYVTCTCGAEYSDTIPECLACGKVNPELPTLNAALPGEKPAKEESIPPTDRAPTDRAPTQRTLNGKDS